MMQCAQTSALCSTPTLVVSRPPCTSIGCHADSAAAQQKRALSLTLALGVTTTSCISLGARLWWRRAASLRVLVRSRRGSAILARSQQDGTEAESRPVPLASDGGLVVWREKYADSSRRDIPCILFPVTDLLLPGQLKRMHLFEPRWVKMVDMCREQNGGVFGLVYWVTNTAVHNVVSIVEVVECSNLGTAGRVVTVRGVARGLLCELKDLADSQLQGKVEEIPEMMSSDFEKVSTLETVSAELCDVWKQLNVMTPAEGAESSATAEGQSSDNDADSQDEKGAEEVDKSSFTLWTHERSTYNASLSDDWAEKVESSQYVLQGVVMAGFSGADEADKDLRRHAACLYAAVGSLKLTARLEFFSRSVSLLAQLTELLEKLKAELKMASAKRAIADALSDTSLD